MSRTIALLVHVDEVDPSAYDGTWSGRLAGPRNDVVQMRRVLSELHDGDAGFESHEIPAAGAAVTRQNLLEWLKWLAGELQAAGDLLVFHYSGHGGTIPNALGGSPDRLNTLCLYDGMLLDAELEEAWSRFAPGVLICMVADACHSGTIASFRATSRVMPLRPRLIERGIPRDVADDCYRTHRNFYDGLVNMHLSASPIAATVLQLAACTDDQRSFEDPSAQPTTGIFTSSLVGLLRATKPPANYQSLHTQVHKIVSERVRASGRAQDPVLLQIGAKMAGLLDRRPFVMDPVT